MTDQQHGAAQSFMGYCVGKNCREKVVVSNPERVVLKNGRHALRGKCPHCGTNVYRLVSKESA